MEIEILNNSSWTLFEIIRGFLLLEGTYARVLIIIFEVNE